MLPRVLLVLVSLLLIKVRAEDRVPVAQSLLMSPQLQQLLQQAARSRWAEGRADLVGEDYSDSANTRRYLRASDLLKALSDKRNFITQIRQPRFKERPTRPR